MFLKGLYTVFAVLFPPIFGIRNAIKKIRQLKIKNFKKFYRVFALCSFKTQRDSYSNY